MNRSMISNAYFDDFVSIGALRHRTACPLMRQFSA
jgi:hypothetical protein